VSCSQTPANAFEAEHHGVDAGIVMLIGILLWFPIDLVFTSGACLVKLT
jgi:hypothetical protein